MWRTGTGAPYLLRASSRMPGTDVCYAPTQGLVLTWAVLLRQVCTAGRVGGQAAPREVSSSTYGGAAAVYDSDADGYGGGDAIYGGGDPGCGAYVAIMEVELAFAQALLTCMATRLVFTESGVPNTEAA
eukprot:532156-Rhodomonas_salina.1